MTATTNLTGALTAAEAQALTEHVAGRCHLSQWSCSHCEVDGNEGDKGGSTVADTSAFDDLEPLEIVCPSWCVFSADHHRAELWNWDGFCIHHGPTVCETGLVSMTTPDGRFHPQYPSVEIYEGDTAVPLRHVEAKGLAFLAMVKEALA